MPFVFYPVYTITHRPAAGVHTVRPELVQIRHRMGEEREETARPVCTWADPVTACERRAGRGPIRTRPARRTGGGRRPDPVARGTGNRSGVTRRFGRARTIGSPAAGGIRGKPSFRPARTLGTAPWSDRARTSPAPPRASPGPPPAGPYRPCGSAPRGRGAAPTSGVTVHHNAAAAPHFPWPVT